MRAWIEPDDDDTPILSILVIENNKIVDGYFRTAYPKKWHIEIDTIPGYYCE